MTEAPYLKRRPPDSEAHGFAELRRLGIELAQQFSGELWTDYNLHDPGVTILEQLAYAITELGYRSDFPVADLLSGTDGIDYTRQALFAPQQIFPCRPSSLQDYRKGLLDAVGELDNCWLQPLGPTDEEPERIDGLYRLLLKVDPGLSEVQRSAVLHKAQHWYQEHRNLCEDLAEVRCVKELQVELCGRIEIDGAGGAVEILAEIYFNAARRIAGAVVPHDPAQALAAGRNLEQIFTGPFTDKGLLEDAELAGECEEFLVSVLYGAINRVDGVARIDDLYLEREGRAYYDTIACDAAEAALQLHIPGQQSEIKVELIADGRSIPVRLEALRARLDEMHFRYYASRSTPQDLSSLYSLPQGVSRQLAEYHSIQHQFPAVYGIGGYGVPASAPPVRKAKARQLQGYLLIFEQIMANYLANLNAIPELFSSDTELSNSYHWTKLQPTQIEGLQELYPQDPDTALANVLGTFDDPVERRNRLLDYLLALYGETYSGDALRHFNGYLEPQMVEERVVQGKIEYLRAVVELGRDRAAAGNLGAGCRREQTLSGLQRRVGLLLGFDQWKGGSLVQGLLEQGLKLARHQTYEHLKRDSREFQFIEQPAGQGAESQRQINALPRWAEVEKLAPEVLWDCIGDAVPLQDGLLSDQLLRQGSQLENYRLCAGPAEEWRLCLLMQDGRLWQLGRYADHEAVVRAGNCLRHLLIQLNRAGEGLHLLEHNLLRPLNDSDDGQAEPSPGADFYPFRISLLFPAWSARCHDLQFRLLAEETVRQNTPSHIYAQCHWLDFYEMVEFEGLYDQWLELRSRATPSAELDRLSTALIRFLLERDPAADGRP